MNPPSPLASAVAPELPAADPANVELRVTMGRLLILRWWLLAGELAAILLTPPLLDIPLPRLPMLAVFALQVLANGLLARRLRHAHGADVDDKQLFMQLIMDLVALAVLMFFSGGAANPLISFLLFPVAIAALALSARRVAWIAALAIVGYSLLMLVYLPLPIADVERAARLHLLGMWFTFVLSVAMMAWFVVRMTASIRHRDAELAAVREQALRDERVVALGALAAGAAHELSTPLATMAVVAGELEHDASLTEAVRADVVLLRKQVLACKAIISGLAERAGAERLDSAAAVRADHWLAEMHGRWLELRPQAAAISRLRWHSAAPAPLIVADATLEQGLLNLFNNAANAGSAIEVSAAWQDDGVTIEIRDNGPGFAPQVLAQAGRAPFPAHAGGSGIGLFLAHAAIARLGGRLTLHNAGGGDDGDDGGGLVRLFLPARRMPPAAIELRTHESP